jgi:hypothetical protein
LPELHLTVDTQIVMIGNGMSNISPTPDHARLIEHFEKDAFLALDKENQVIAEYERKLGTESEGRRWLDNLFRNDRIRLHSLAKLTGKVRVELDKVHFHQSDRKFVRLAMTTDSKRLVAQESDYSKAVCNVLKKHAEVIVLSAGEACDLIAVRRDEAQPGH